MPHRWSAVTVAEGTSAGAALPQVQREDEKQAMMAGLQQKALTSEGVEKHLVDFGLEVEAASHTTIQSARTATWRLCDHGAFRIWTRDYIDRVDRYSRQISELDGSPFQMIPRAGNGFLRRSLSGGQKVKVVLGASMWSAGRRNSIVLASTRAAVLE